MTEPVKESFKQVNSNTWVIGAMRLCRSSCYSDTATWNDDCDNSSYTITDAPSPRPPATSLRLNNPYIALGYDAGDSSAVWAIGNNAFCKVKLIIKDTMPEATTIKFRIPGWTLIDAWPSLNKDWRQHYVNAVVNTCEDMANWKGHILSGVDGKNIPEQYLVRNGAAKEFSPMNLQKGCRAMSMDCSSFVFYHAGLGPENIIVEKEPILGTVGIIDWETAGYFPRGWISTKFRVSSGMDFPTSVANNPTRWRSEVQKMLEINGFEDFSNAWQSWWF